MPSHVVGDLPVNILCNYEKDGLDAIVETVESKCGSAHLDTVSFVISEFLEERSNTVDFLRELLEFFFDSLSIFVVRRLAQAFLVPVVVY